VSASLERPAGQYVDPGPDQRLPSLSEAVDMVLMIAGADRQIDPTEMREIQRLMNGLQMISEQKAAAGQDEGQGAEGEGGAEDFGETEGTEAATNTGPAPGAEYAGPGY